MKDVGPKDPQGYYIIKIPKKTKETIKELLNNVELIPIDNENILIRTKSRKTITKIIKKLNPKN
ncbi:MAG: hypothetical protein QXO98_05150 [Sulfolobales archaeon]